MRAIAFEHLALQLRLGLPRDVAEQHAASAMTQRFSPFLELVEGFALLGAAVAGVDRCLMSVELVDPLSLCERPRRSRGGDVVPLNLGEYTLESGKPRAIELSQSARPRIVKVGA